MKKTVLSLLFAAAALCVSGQKGTFWAGGGLGFSSSKNDSSDLLSKSDGKNTRFSGSLNIEYYLADTWSCLVGPEVYIGHEKRNDFLDSDNWRNYDSKRNMAGAFLAVRKYIPVFGNLRLYAELEGGGQWGTLKQVYTETYGGSEDAENLKFKLSNWNVNLSPGLAYTVAGKFTITASIGNVGYFKDTEKDKNNGRSSSISGFDCDFSTFFSGFGVSFKL